MIKLDCDFIITPRIIFNDKSLSRTDIDVLSLIISLALKSNYCYANNEYLANYINSSKRTISDSLSKLKKLKYVIVKYENKKRRLYLNTEKIPTKVSDNVAKKCNNTVAESCYHNINSKYKNKYKEEKPKWMIHPELCKEQKASKEEIKNLKEKLKKISK